MIESRNEVNKNLEKALRTLAQAKQKVAQREEKAEREETQSREPP